MPPEILIPAPALAARVRDLGAALSAARGPEPLILVALMDGAFVFAADLARAIPEPDLTLVFRRASSYRGTTSTGTVTLEDPPALAGADVWVVDDILDTGLTLAAATAACRAAGAARVRTCVCLDKPMRRAPGGLATADLTGFTIEDRFVVGYGLDHDGKWRHLPEVRALA